MPCAFSDEELRQIRLRVLMLIGDQDRLNPPKALERARQTIPYLEGEIIPRVGHFLNMEQPEALNARILKFLTEAESPDPASRDISIASARCILMHQHPKRMTRIV